MPRLQSHLRLQTSFVILIDIACLLSGVLIGAFFRFNAEEVTSYVANHIDGYVIFITSIIMANYLAGSYHIQGLYSKFNIFITWLFSMFFSMLVLSITSFPWFSILLGRGVITLSLVSYGLLAMIFKFVFYKKLMQSNLFMCRTVIISGGESADNIRKTVENELVQPIHKVVAVISVSSKYADSFSVDNTKDRELIKLSATADNLHSTIINMDADLLIVAKNHGWQSEKLYPILRKIRFEGIEVMSELVTAETYSGRTPIAMLTEDDLMIMSSESEVPILSRLKRITDIMFAIIAIIVFLPVMVFMALVIKLERPGAPIFYTQNRTGQFRKIFRIFKFRTMRPNAENETGPVWSLENDARITKVGKFIRKFRLDELPQLINVIKGDMSLVGPRPERPEIVAELDEKVPFYSERLNVLPGLTGWAQIRYPYGSTVEDALRKLEFDLYYMKNVSFSFDLQILLSTIRIMIFGKER